MIFKYWQQSEITGTLHSAGPSFFFSGMKPFLLISSTSSDYIFLLQEKSDPQTGPIVISTSADYHVCLDDRILGFD